MSQLLVCHFFIDDMGEQGLTKRYEVWSGKEEYQKMLFCERHTFWITSNPFIFYHVYSIKKYKYKQTNKCPDPNSITFRCFKRAIISYYTGCIWEKFESSPVYCSWGEEINMLYHIWGQSLRNQWVHKSRKCWIM